MASPEHKSTKPEGGHENPLEPTAEQTDEVVVDGHGMGDPVGGESERDVDTDASMEELNDRYLRLAADFENYKKRTAREWQTRAESATTELLFELLDIVDNFERALNAEHEESAYAQGVRLIYDQVQNLLKRRDVVPMQAMATEFNPEVHDALLHVHSDDVADGRVCQVIKGGYEYRGRVLRPAQVAVSRGPGASVDAPSDADAVSSDTAEADDSK
jgi:molecular chaperone GrpE